MRESLPRFIVVFIALGLVLDLGNGPATAARQPGSSQNPGSGTDAPPQPNILLILVDDLGWSDVGCYGNPAVDTPRIDAFCATALKFTDAYAAAPVCSPTRASIMTGWSPARLRITNHMPDEERFWPDDPALLPADCRDRLDLDHVTLAEVLQQAGYRTGFIGKWHLAPQTGTDKENFYPNHQGFEVNIGGTGAGGPGPSFFAPWSFPNLESTEENEYLPYRIGTEATRWLRDHQEKSTDQPFFLALWHYTVHWPMDSPADLLAKYQSRGRRPGIKDPRYAGMTEALDQIFGRVLDVLDDSGLASNTVVVFTSDNGALLSVADCRPLRMGKGYLYEGGIRVPLLIRWPGVTRAGSVTSTPVISTDLFPTLVRAGNGLLPDGYPGDGVDLYPLLTGGTIDRDSLYFHYPNYAWHRSNRLGGAVRQGDYKLIQRYDDDSVELYNLADDIGEQHDLATRLPDRAAAMQHQLRQWLKSTDAAMPKPAVGQ